jgi:hypothetical protein
MANTYTALSPRRLQHEESCGVHQAGDRIARLGLHRWRGAGAQADGIASGRHRRPHSRAGNGPGDAFAEPDHTISQRRLVEMDSPGVPRIARLRLAGRVRGVHGEQIEPARRDPLHQEPARTSPAKDVSGGVPGFPTEARD